MIIYHLFYHHSIARNKGAQICNMIMRNKSDVGHIAFEILAKTGFLCFILF